MACIRLNAGAVPESGHAELARAPKAFETRNRAVLCARAGQQVSEPIILEPAVAYQADHQL